MDEIVSASMSLPEHDRRELADVFALFDITETDGECLRELAPYASEVADEVIDAFYDHILGFEHLKAKFADAGHFAKVKAGQKRFFENLVGAEPDSVYIEERRRIGRIHEQAEVNPALYIGAYSYYLNRLGELVLAKVDDPARAFRLTRSLQKMAHFDMALALETYVEAREKTIEMTQREIRELPTPVLSLREGLLLIPVVGTLDGLRARQLTVQMLEGIRQHRARAVVLDITGVSVVDSAVANHLMQTIAAGRLMGAMSVLTGISAEVAQSMVRIGIAGDVFNTAGDLQGGIEKAEAYLDS
jgi:rsbT co-antagonist protein RsbR